MHRYLHFVLVAGLVLGLAACDAFSSDALLQQIAAPDDAALPDSIQQQYRADAAQLAMRYVQAKGAASDAVELPDDRIQLFYNALVHVYEARHLSARDRVVDLHTFPRYNVHEIIVAVDTSVPWTNAWKEGERLTGESNVDALIQEYDVSVQYKAWSHQPAALIRSEEPINTVALSQRFERLDGVVYAEQNGYVGGGNDIEATVGATGIVLTYSRGWGDCPAGCIHRETWTFWVDADGTVRFRNHDEQ